jgi:hypothetical protein
MRTLVSLISLVAVTLSAQAQSASDQPTAVIDRLWAAMAAGDSAATRALFTPAGRVLPVPAPGAPQTPGPGLSVDQFVRFVAQNPVGSWRERMWSPSVRLNGALADVWFEYDVYRAGKFDHCGFNAVQLQSTGGGWKIMSMAFTSATVGCAPHNPP